MNNASKYRDLSNETFGIAINIDDYIVDNSEQNDEKCIFSETHFS